MSAHIRCEDHGIHGCRECAAVTPERGEHKPSCPAYSNYQPPYEDCTCRGEMGLEQFNFMPFAEGTYYDAGEVDASLLAAREERDRWKESYDLLLSSRDKTLDALRQERDGWKDAVERQAGQLRLVNSECVKAFHAQEAAEASLSQCRELLARALDEMESLTAAVDAEFRISTDPPDVEYEQFVADIKRALAQTEPADR